MLLSRWKSFAGGLLALGAVVLAASAGRSPIEGQARAVGQDDPPRAKAAEAPKQDEPARARPSRGRMGPTLQTITVVGRARDREGKPIAGATVFVTDANGRRAGGSPLVLRETKTPPNGRFVLDVFPLPVWPPDPGPIPKPTEGKYEVAGWAPGYGFAWDRVRSFAPDPAKSRDPVVEIDLVFGPPARLHGRVTDDLGKPIAGAKVQVGYIDDPRRPDGGGHWRCEAIDPEGGEPRPFNGVQAIPESIRSTRTDGRGEYHLDGLPREAQFLALIDADPAVEPEALTLATTDRPIKGVRSVGSEGTLNHSFEMPRKVWVSLHHDPDLIWNFIVRAEGGRMLRSGAKAMTGGGNQGDTLNLPMALPPGSYTLTVEPPAQSPYLPAEKPIVVGKAPFEQVFDVNVESGAIVNLEAIDAETGEGIAGVGFDYVTDTSRERRELQSTPGIVDHPTTDAEGRLRAVMEPGGRRFFVAKVPDRYDLKVEQSPMLALTVAGPNTFRFEFQPKPKEPAKTADDLSGPDGELRKRLGSLWRQQREKARRASFSARRSWQPADGIARDELRTLLDSLDPDATPNLREKIANAFPEAPPATEIRLGVVVDEPRRREVQRPLIRAKTPPYSDVTVFNGKEEIRYDSVNAQADIFGQQRIAITGLNDFAHRPHVSDDSQAARARTPRITRAGRRATIEWVYGPYVSRTVVDETTGFLYRDSFLSKNGQSQEIWQFDPRTYPNGVTLASVSVEVHSAKDGIDSIFIRSLDAVAFDPPMSPETFLVAAPAGTMILDHRDEKAARNDAYRGVLRGPIGDVVAYADRVAAKRKPPEPPRFKEGDPAQPLDPAAWLDRDGPAAPPDLKGKVVLIDFWGITCGPCVAELPDVREAAEHFDRAGLIIVGLHDSSGSIPEVAAFAGKRHLSYPIAIDRPDAKSNGFGATFEDYGVRSIPSAAVLDRQGRIAYVGRFKEALARAAELLEKPAK